MKEEKYVFPTIPSTKQVEPMVGAALGVVLGDALGVVLGDALGLVVDVKVGFEEGDKVGAGKGINIKSVTLDVGAPDG